LTTPILDPEMPQPCQAMLGLSGWRMSPGTPEDGLSMRRIARESLTWAVAESKGLGGDRLALHG